MSTYCTEADVRLRWGDRNVEQWGDLDNTGDLQRIALRVARAIEDASNDVDSALLNGPYVFPVVAPVAVPERIRRVTVELAGWYLYSARGMLHDEENDARLMNVKRAALADLAAILKGTIKLPLDPAGATRIMGVVRDDDASDPCRRGCTCPEEVTSRLS